MKILEISSAVTFGGGERHLVDLAKGFAERGHSVFAAIRENISWHEKLSFLESRRIYTLPLKNSLDIFSARKLARIIRDNDIQIVHAHLARDYMVASLAVRMAPQAKLVLSRHVLFSMNPAYQFLLNNVSKAIAVSEAVRLELTKTFPAEKIRLIHNGIDVKRFGENPLNKEGDNFRFEHNIPFDAPLIATVGELKPLKGQRDFVLAAQLVAEKFPDAYFAVVGKDNSIKNDFRREIRRMVKVFGLEKNFLWLDWVEDTKPLLQALDVFVSASHSESFGLAILEAMASATAVVATETAGAREILGETVNLVPIETPVKLAEKICELLESEEVRLKLATRLQTRAVQNFGIEKTVEETENLFREILSK